MWGSRNDVFLVTAARQNTGIDCFGVGEVGPLQPADSSSSSSSLLTFRAKKKHLSVVLQYRGGQNERDPPASAARGRSPAPDPLSLR